MADRTTIETAVRERYGAIARDVLEGEASGGCCEGSGCCGPTHEKDAISAALYSEAEAGEIPDAALLASLGCGNPTALAALSPGETVLDLGSGGGIDVLLSARRVGPDGHAYGLDMTDEMLALARRNAAEAGVSNVTFLKGDIAAIPLPDASVDVIISNCVINLAADKEAVYREAFRVLRPGGRLAISDIVIHGELPGQGAAREAIRRSISAWTGCIAGAQRDVEVHAALESAGFEAIDLEVTRRLVPIDMPAGVGPLVESLGRPTVERLLGQFASTFIRARRPQRSHSA